jgi:hypothetical protein
MAFGRAATSTHNFAIVLGGGAVSTQASEFTAGATNNTHPINMCRAFHTNGAQTQWSLWNAATSGALAGASFSFAGLILAGSHLWGDNLAVAAGSTSGPTSYLAHSPTWYPTATAVVLTARGANFTGGNVEAAVHYATLVAPTS